jgi:hypothetical protein
MEGGAQTYSPFATGPFAFRVAPLVSEPEEKQDRLPDPDDLDPLLAGHPPGLVLIGDEGDAEQPLFDYAHRHAIPMICLSSNGALFPPGEVPMEQPHENWSNISRYVSHKLRSLFASR